MLMESFFNTITSGDKKEEKRRAGEVYLMSPNFN